MMSPDIILSTVQKFFSIRRINQLSPGNRNNSRQARERHAYFAQPDTHQIASAPERREEVVKCETELVSSR